MGLPKTAMAEILRSVSREDDKLRGKAAEFVRSLSEEQKKEFRER
jgi:hypothetical protein